MIIAQLTPLPVVFSTNVGYKAHLNKVRQIWGVNANAATAATAAAAIYLALYYFNIIQLRRCLSCFVFCYCFRCPLLLRLLPLLLLLPLPPLQRNNMKSRGARRSNTSAFTSYDEHGGILVPPLLIRFQLSATLGDGGSERKTDDWRPLLASSVRTMTLLLQRAQRSHVTYLR